LGRRSTRKEYFKLIRQIYNPDYGIIWYFATNYKQKKSICLWRGANKVEYRCVREERYFDKETMK
jgi:hypothetical protein